MYVTGWSMLRHQQAKDAIESGEIVMVTENSRAIAVIVPYSAYLAIQSFLGRVIERPATLSALPLPPPVTEEVKFFEESR